MTETRLTLTEAADVAASTGFMGASETWKDALALLIEHARASAAEAEKSSDEIGDVGLAVALVLGHSRDYARTMNLRHLLDAVRMAALETERCGSCPWTRVGSGIECGGAAGICEGNTRPPLDAVLDSLRVAS